MTIPALRALSERSFLYLWIGEIFTQIAVNLFNFFLILLVFKETQSNTAVSGIVLSFTVPAILFGSIAGVFVDRWNKKKVLIVTNLLRALALLVLVFFPHNLFVIYTISFIVTLITQFFIPAESPILPLIVKRENLLSANALFGMAIFGSILVAYILAGPLLSALKPINTVILLASLFVISSMFIAFIKLTYAKDPDMKKNDGKLNIISDLQATISLMLRTKEIFRSLILLALSQMLVLIIATIAPGYASEILGIPVEEFSILFITPAALGMVLGAITLANVFNRHSKDKIITLGIFLSGLAMLLMPYGSKVSSRDFVHVLNTYLPHFLDINILHIMMVLAFILGVSNALVFVPANTILQEKSSEEIRGRLYGFLNTIVGVISLLPVIIVGGLSDLIGVGTVITWIGLIIIAFGVSRISIK